MAHSMVTTTPANQQLDRRVIPFMKTPLGNLRKRPTCAMVPLQAAFVQAFNNPSC
jgi:hypothetical protein